MARLKSISARRRRPGAERARSMEPRLQKQHVAKRKLPKSVNARQWKPPAWGMRALGFCGLWLAASLALLAGWGLMATSPAFAVKEAEVQGTRHLSRLEVLSAGGVGGRSNLLALPVSKIEARIRKLPWVEDVDVSRSLPGTVRISITEQAPKYLALTDSGFFHLDAKLRSFASMAGERPPDLPVITGMGKSDLLEPDGEIQRLLDMAKLLLAQLPKAWLEPGGRLSEVHIDRIWGLSLVLEDLPAVVRLGFSGFGERIRTLARVERDLRKRGELARAVLIDLDHHRRAVVRLAPEAA